MNEAKIMKALECCYAAKCSECPYEIQCIKLMVKDALDLINRKNAENERLQRLGASAARRMVKARAEAIKEFAERVGLYWLQFVIDEIREFATKAGLDPVYSFNPTEKELNEKHKEILEWLDQIAKEMGVEL